MTWVQDQLDDETLFPSKIGVPFPNNFLNIAKTILKRLFRVYAHVYHQHFKVRTDQLLESFPSIVVCCRRLCLSARKLISTHLSNILSTSSRSSN